MGTEASARGLCHVVWFTSGALRIVDVWEAAEDFRRFARERLMPVVAGELGLLASPGSSSILRTPYSCPYTPQGVGSKGWQLRLVWSCPLIQAQGPLTRVRISCSRPSIPRCPTIEANSDRLVTTMLICSTMTSTIIRRCLLRILQAISSGGWSV